MFKFDFTLSHKVTYLDGASQGAPFPVTSAKGQHNCPYRVPTLDEIAADIDRAAYGKDKRKFVSDIFECGAIAISNRVDISQITEREKRYMEIIKSYSPKERNRLAEIFGKIVALLSSVVYDDGEFDDYLGRLFMQCKLASEDMGQFFTPYHISKLMAHMTFEKSHVRKLLADNKYITVSDPCCGGGGMLVASLDVLRSYGVNYAAECLIDCGDVDIRCVHMTYLQLSLAGASAIVRHKDALTNETWSVWYTPAYIFQYMRFAQ